ncbi:hypothetical protein CEXT_565611 [Caerostris extrusa]|uniref:Secreted protein n=1 Tax=Caerostris extrusa TaxID=172846 RepID=A0AAV4VBT9_CAEEX|nr:hypothetical protein CEXT_565611 [Caerostris extrusa]
MLLFSWARIYRVLCNTVGLYLAPISKSSSVQSCKCSFLANKIEYIAESLCMTCKNMVIRRRLLTESNMFKANVQCVALLLGTNIPSSV